MSSEKFKYIVDKIEKSRRPPAYKNRNIVKKINYRLIKFTADILSKFLSKLYFKFFLYSHESQSLIGELIKRKIWKTFCEFHKKKENTGLYLFKNYKDDIYYLLKSNETSISEEVFSIGNYDKRYFDQALDLFPFERVKKKLFFFDVGANSGTFTLLAIKSKYFNKIISIEPHLETFNILRANLLLNNIEFNSNFVKLYNLAIDPVEKKLNLRYAMILQVIIEFV